MAEFKPMVKMYTDEPSVSLKLKKGGHVKHHAKGGHEEHHGHKAMHHAVGGHMHGAHHAFESEHGKAPKKPSMAERRKSMNPQMYKKGGKVAHKVDGGMMGMGAAPAAPMAPMTRSALMGMAPAARMARAAAVRRALTGMKKGGSAEAHCAKLEKELKHHESLSMAKAHPVKKASGGEIDAAETRTTLKGNVKKFAKDFMVTGQKHDSAHGTGEIKEGKPGGYKHGGHAKHHGHGGKVHHISGHPVGSHEHHKHMAKHHAKMHKEGGSAHHAKMHEHHKHMAKMCKGGKYAVGGEVPSETNESQTRGKSVMGGTIEGNEHFYENTEMHTAKPDHAHGTGGVSMSNAGGFKKGGKMHHKASGGTIDKKLTRTTVEGGNWENRPANTAKPGKKGTHTGEVHESNAGGFKHGGHASKKAYATGGNVVDDGKAVKMPRHFVSQPVANSLQSGTFKRGGKVKHHADGGDVPAAAQSAIKQADANRAYKNWEESETASNKAMREAVLGFPRRAYEAVKGAFSSAPPAGSVTKTEKSVTVSPGKKRGGKC